MRINITARKFKLNDDLRVYTEEEVMRIKKYYEDIIDVEVILAWEKKDRLAEINIQVNGKMLTAHERSEEMKKSIALAVDKLERQIRKYKDRRHGFDHESIKDIDTIIEE